MRQSVSYALEIVQFLYFVNPKLPASNHLLRLYSPVCVGPDRNPNCWFSHAQAHIIYVVNGDTLQFKHRDLNPLQKGKKCNLQKSDFIQCFNLKMNAYEKWLEVIAL